MNNKSHGLGGGEAYPNGLWAQGRVHPEYVGSLSGLGRTWKLSFERHLHKPLHHHAAPIETWFSLLRTFRYFTELNMMTKNWRRQKVKSFPFFLFFLSVEVCSWQKFNSLDWMNWMMTWIKYEFQKVRYTVLYSFKQCIRT